MRKALILLVLLLTAFTACAEGATVDFTDRVEIRDRDVKAFLEELAAYPAGTRVELTGVKISPVAQGQLVDARPDLDFHWEVVFNGQKVDSDTVHLDLDKLERKVGVKTLIAALKAMPKLNQVTMYNYRYSVKEMETVLAAYPHITFDWTVRVGDYLVRTDATAFSTLKGRQDPRYTAKQLEPLKYCTKLEALDFGHNNVYDLSFLSYWPHLKRLIIIDSKKPVTDLTPLAELHELEYVELFMQDITDLTPLSNKPNLLDLNLCHNNVTDLTPLYTNTKLERLWISYNKNLTEEEVAAFKAAVPGCQVETVEYQSTGAGWREHPRYFIMAESFKTRMYVPFDAE